MPFTMDYTGVQESTFEPLPEGDYTLRITETKETKTKERGLPMVNVTLEVVGGEYAKRKVFHNVVFIPKGDPGDGISKHWLKVIGQTNDGRTMVRPGTWVGALLSATLTIEKYEGKARNKVTDTRSIEKKATETAEVETSDKEDSAPF